MFAFSDQLVGLPWCNLSCISNVCLLEHWLRQHARLSDYAFLAITLLLTPVLRCSQDGATSWCQISTYQHCHLISIQVKITSIINQSSTTIAIDTIYAMTLHDYIHSQHAVVMVPSSKLEVFVTLEIELLDGPVWIVSRTFVANFFPSTVLLDQNVSLSAYLLVDQVVSFLRFGVTSPAWEEHIAQFFSSNRSSTLAHAVPICNTEQTSTPAVNTGIPCPYERVG